MKRCQQIVTHMVMSIISAVASSIQLSLAVTAAAWDVYDLDFYGCYYHVGAYHPGSRVHVRCLAHFLALYIPYLLAYFRYHSVERCGSVCRLFAVKSCLF